MSNKQMQNSTSPQLMRKRKMMLVFPLLALPFVTMAFWALGGGSGGDSQNENLKTGLNMELPNAHPKEDNAETKLSFYEKADADSFKLGRQKSNDPFLEYTERDTSDFRAMYDKLEVNKNSLYGENYKDPNEEKVYRKLDQLNEQLRSTPIQKNANSRPSEVGTFQEKDGVNNLLEKLPKDSEAEDPEMKQLNSMMDKILDIQHPGRIKEQFDERNVGNSQQVFAVNRVASITSVSLLDTSIEEGKDNNNFYSLDKESEDEQNSIEAVVHEDQTLVNGAVIKLRLLDNITVDENVIPQNNFIYGKVSLNGERLRVDVSSIRVNHSLFPIKLHVYDLDGLEGIYIPGAVTRDVAKESLNSATQMMELSSLDPSMRAKAESAGIDAVKNLLTRKTKLVRVTVKSGYKILLK